MRKIVAAILVLFIAAGAFAADIDAARLQRTSDALIDLGHRLAGTEQGRAAGDIIIERLRAEGIEPLIQRFDVTQLHVDACWFERDGRRVELQPLRPNGLALPVTPPEGLSGQTVYLRSGLSADFRGIELDGRIAVMDGDCGDRWIDAFARGAVAVIFIEPGMDDASPKWVNAHAALPRFCVDRETAQREGLLAGAPIRIVSRLSFNRVEGRNIIAIIPGRQTPDQAVALACAYDTFGVVPLRSPGRRQAANVAALIELAGQFSREPAGRTVIVAFFDNDAQDLSGQLQFHLARLTDPDGVQPGSPAVLAAAREAERQARESLLAALQDPVAVIEARSAADPDQRARRQLLAEVEVAYELRAGNLTQTRMRLAEVDRAVRHAREALERSADGSANGDLQRDVEAAEKERAQQKPELERLVQELSAEKEKWKKLRLAMMSGRMPQRHDDAETNDLFDQLVADLRQREAGRLAEIERENAHLDDVRRIAERLEGTTLQALVHLNLAPRAVPWTVQIPSSAMPLVDADHGGAYALVANAALSRWVHQQHDAAADRWPHRQWLPANVEPNVSDTRASAQATFVVEIGSAGAAPLDGDVDSRALAERLGEVSDFVRELADRPEASATRVPPRVSTFVTSYPQWTGGGRFSGDSVNRYGGTSVEAERPVAGATVWITPAPDDSGVEEFRPDRWGGKLVTTQVSGHFPLLVDGPAHTRVQMVAAVHDEQGRITGITQLNPAGAVGQPGNWNAPSMFNSRQECRLAMFDGVRAATLVRLSSLADARPPLARDVQILDAVSGAPPRELNLTLSGDVLSIYSRETQHWKLVRGSQLLINNTPRHPEGAGYPFSAGGVVDVAAKAPADLWRLNEDRLGNLRRHGVLQDSLEQLHERAEAHWDQSGELADPAESSAHSLASHAYSARAYQPVRSVTNDLIHAVVILLLLAIPFAFVLERLLIGTANVHLQIVGFGAIFAVVFGILYIVHPAFRFATFPIVVLLAFMIIIMSGLVIFIMWGKFEYEIRSLQGVATASHRSTRNARSTVVAAVAQGISSMRRRPLRTALTAITIILLTFSILFFGSFGAEGGLRRLPIGAGSSVRQVEIRATPDQQHGFSAAVVRTLRSLYPDQRSFIRQWGLGADDTVLPGLLPGGAAFAVEGWATLAPEEFELHPELRHVIRGDIAGFLREGGIFLPESIAAGREGTVEFLGRRWVLRGTFDPQGIREVRTLEGASLLPPAIAQVRRTLKLQFPRDKAAVRQKLKEMELADFPVIDGESVALVSLPPAADAGLAAQSITFLPSDDRAAERIAGEIATMLGQRVTVCTAGQTARVIYATQLSLSGISKTLVPLLLGGLIIFGSMLSSVSDRSKEVFTYSALGLAPRHVAILFFAEAAVYALLGAIGGYLFSQVFAKTVEAMAQRGWVEAPTMNYSSMNAMLTIVIIMATVLISTIYPAYKASRSANPGAQRRWRMPKPQDDEYRIAFPFTVSAYDLVGLISFLEEYLLGHRDKSLGSFAADDVRMERVDEGFVLTARVWLQPFDQGVSQTFELRTLRSDIPGIDEVHLRLQRLSGSPVIWQRSNAVFIGDLRQQFIFWRTIPEEMMDHYHQTTLDRFGLTEVEEATA